MKVRKLSLVDLPHALELIDQFEREPAPRPNDTQLETIYQQITQSGGAVLGAEIDGSIVGTCTLTICPNLSWSGRPYAMIENVIVTEAYRGHGIGKALMLEAQQLAESAGCYKVAVMTGSKRASTHQFYQQSGFVGSKIGFQKRFNA